MLNVNLSGSLPVVSCSSPASVCNYVKEAGNALLLTETASETIINSVIADCSFRDKQDVLDTFHFAGLIDSPCINPVSIYNRLKADIKAGKRSESDYSTIAFTYMREKTKYESVIEYPVFLVLFRLYNRLKKRAADMKAKQDKALETVSTLLDAFSRGENVGDRLALALETCEKLNVDSETCNQARKAILHKTILKRSNAIYHDLVVLSADIALNADVHHTNMLACIFRGKGYVNKADAREKIFTSPAKYSKPEKGSYKEKRRQNNLSFYRETEKANADFLQAIEKERMERLQKERDAAAANLALLQTLQNNLKQIAAICADVPASGKGLKKDDMLAKIVAIAKIASVVP